MTSPSSKVARAALKARSRPSMWRAVRRRRHLATRLAPNRHAKGQVELAANLRRVLWAWWIWGGIAAYHAIAHKWGWAIGTGLVATFAFLLQPRSEAPRYGLDHDLPVTDAAFCETVAGATKAAYVA